MDPALIAALLEPRIMITLGMAATLHLVGGVFDSRASKNDQKATDIEERTMSSDQAVELRETRRRTAELEKLGRHLTVALEAREKKADGAKKVSTVVADDDKALTDLVKSLGRITPLIIKNVTETNEKAQQDAREKAQKEGKRRAMENKSAKGSGQRNPGKKRR